MRLSVHVEAKTLTTDAKGPYYTTHVSLRQAGGVVSGPHYILISLTKEEYDAISVGDTFEVTK